MMDEVVVLIIMKLGKSKFYLISGTPYLKSISNL